MSEAIIKKDTLIEIADAIRTKLNSNEKILVSELPDKILSISSGGQEWALLDTITPSTMDGYTGPKFLLSSTGQIGNLYYSISQDIFSYTIYDFSSNNIIQGKKLTSDSTAGVFTMDDNGDIQYLHPYSYNKTIYFLPLYMYQG